MLADPDEQIAAARRKYLSEAGYTLYENAVRASGFDAYTIDDEGIERLMQICDSAPDFECGAELRASAQRHAARLITAARVRAQQQRMAKAVSERRLPVEESMQEKAPGLREAARDDNLERKAEADRQLAARYDDFRAFSDSIGHF